MQALVLRCCTPACSIAWPNCRLLPEAMLLPGCIWAIWAQDHLAWPNLSAELPVRTALPCPSRCVQWQGGRLDGGDPNRHRASSTHRVQRHTAGKRSKAGRTARSSAQQSIKGGTIVHTSSGTPVPAPQRFPVLHRSFALRHWIQTHSFPGTAPLTCLLGQLPRHQCTACRPTPGNSLLRPLPHAHAAPKLRYKSQAKQLPGHRASAPSLPDPYAPACRGLRLDGGA